MWCDKYLEAKRKLRYYKEVIDPTLQDQKYLYVLTSSKKKTNMSKIRTNSHQLHSETSLWTVPKTPWVERICHLCENRNIEDENHFLLECQIFIIQASIMILGSLTERITCTAIKHKRQETQRIFLRETIKEKTPQLPPRQNQHQK